MAKTVAVAVIRAGKLHAPPALLDPGATAAPALSLYNHRILFLCLFELKVIQTYFKRIAQLWQEASN